MEAAKQKMVPIPIREFVTVGVAPVDLYILLHGQKYVLLAKEGSKDSAERIKMYESKAVEVLYVCESDYARYTAQSVSLTEAIINSNEISTQLKSEYLIKSSNSVMHEMNILGFNNETYEHAKAIAQQTLLLVERNPQVLQCMDSLAKLSNSLLAHSVAVSLFSVMLGRSLGWNSKATLEKLALGGLLHDIGLRQVNPEVLSKPYSELSFDELQMFEAHPFKGMEILRTLPQIPDDVIAIVFEHHENSIGQGYPRKIRDLRMNPLAKVVATADQFVELTFVGLDPSMAKKSPDEALQYIERVMGKPFNREVFAALKVLVQNRLSSAA